MAKSSINFQKATPRSTDHNFRKDKPDYLLPKELQKENEFLKHKKSELEIFEYELSIAKRKGGRIPKFDNSRWEAVLNLNVEHNMEDVKKVAEHIQKKFNITCSGIAIHRDEGYIDNNGKPHYNYHAHLNFVTYKNSRQNWRHEHIRPKHLRALQTKVADILSMDRGEYGSQAVRLDHRQQRSASKAKATLKAVKAEVAELRKELQEENESLTQKISVLENEKTYLGYDIEGLKENMENVEIEFKRQLKKNDALGKQYREEIRKNKELEEFIAKTEEHKDIATKKKKENNSLKELVQKRDTEIKELKLQIESNRSSEPEALILNERSEIDIQEVKEFMRGASSANQNIAKFYLSARKKYEPYAICEESPVLLEIFLGRGIDVKKLKDNLETYEEALHKVMNSKTRFQSQDFEEDNEQKFFNSPRF